jgi:hypothetical protein
VLFASELRRDIGPDAIAGLRAITVTLARGTHAFLLGWYFGLATVTQTHHKFLSLSAIPREWAFQNPLRPYLFP